MDEIIDSICNGQRKQALEQLRDSDYYFEDLLRRLLEDGVYDDVQIMFQLAISTGHLKEEE